MQMDQGGIPPIISDVSSNEPGVSRGRWWVHLCVLALFPIVPGVMGYAFRHKQAPLLPGTVGGLLRVSGVELAFFGTLFAIAWVATRVNAKELLLSWRGGVMPAVLGFGYSLLLRGVILVVVVLAAVALYVATGMHPEKLQQMRPETEHLIKAGAMTQNPVYFVLCLTLISFVVAALREELWRAAMLAGINALFPRQFAGWPGKAVGVLVVALLFGLGHTAQGLSGVGMTAFLGIGLGAIMLVHRSIWPAVIAHGFFDAASFAGLYVLAKYFPGQVPGL